MAIFLGTGFEWPDELGDGLARGNTGIILSNLRFVRGGAADEDRYGQFSDQHSRWNKKRGEYRYAHEEFRRPRMGGFGGRHCR